MNEQERAEHIKALNEAFRLLQPEQRITALYRNYRPDQVMLTSSFAATSAYLLHLFSVYKPEQEVLIHRYGLPFRGDVTLQGIPH